MQFVNEMGKKEASLYCLPPLTERVLQGIHPTGSKKKRKKATTTTKVSQNKLSHQFTHYSYAWAKMRTKMRINCWTDKGVKCLFDKYQGQ